MFHVNVVDLEHWQQPNELPMEGNIVHTVQTNMWKLIWKQMIWDIPKQLIYINV